MSSTDDDWTRFNRRRRPRPTRELLRRTLSCIEYSGAGPGVAVDLGCGSGADALEMLNAGWTVHAVDADPVGLALLAEAAGPELAARLQVHPVRFEDFEFPACDLVWAGHSLPFCPAAALPAVWQSIIGALRPNGRFAGDFFGDRHGFSGSDGVHVLTEAAVRSMLDGLTIEAFDTEDGWRPSGGVITRWHAFGVSVIRNPKAPHPLAPPALDMA